MSMSDCDFARTAFLWAHSSGRELPAEEVQHFDACDDCRRWRDDFYALSPEAVSMLMLLYEMEAALTRPEPHEGE